MPNQVFQLHCSLSPIIESESLFEWEKKHNLEEDKSYKYARNAFQQKKKKKLKEREFFTRK